MSKHPSLSHLLKSKHFPKVKDSERHEEELKKLQSKMLRIQQGIWHQKKRVILVFEGTDAAGKGGAIQRLTELLDPRGFRVHPIGPPEGTDQQKHYLFRFWQRLPAPGTIAIFDRSWYGRVLVEKVEGLTDKERIHQAYSEIRHFENMLVDDGIEVVKVFLAISKDEQLRRFDDRLKDPYKQWKLTTADVAARKKWNDYVKATDKIFAETSTSKAPWKLIAANDKDYARIEVLKYVTEALEVHAKWMEKKGRKMQIIDLKKSMRELGLKESL